LGFECGGVSAAVDESDTAELDIDAWSVRNPRTGQTLTVSPVPQQLLVMMLGGGIYPVLEREGLIASR
jgi:3-isopropylmalate/(R)-2-methylmalate dehydratase small subunit